MINSVSLFLYLNTHFGEDCLLKQISSRRKLLEEADKEEEDLLFYILSQFVAVLAEEGMIDGELDKASPWVQAVLGQLSAFVRKYRIQVWMLYDTFPILPYQRKVFIDCRVGCIHSFPSVRVVIYFLLPKA